MNTSYWTISIILYLVQKTIAGFTVDVLNSVNERLPQIVPPPKVISPADPPIYFQPPRYTMHTFGLPNMPSIQPLKPLKPLPPLPSIVIIHKKNHRPKFRREEMGGLTTGQTSLPEISSESSSIEFELSSSAKPYQI